MMITTALTFIIFCGLLGFFLRRNYLNSMVSLLQIIIGINGLLIKAQEKDSAFQIYLIIFTVFIFILYMYATAVVLIRRRSTLQINELAELRG